MSLVFAVVNDLYFADRIRTALERLGHQAQVVDLSAGDSPVVPAGAALALVDLEAGEPALAVVQAAGAAGVPVLAFGPHTDLGLRERALAAGAAQVVAKSKLTNSFAELIAAFTH